ncbi:type II toxin-antitoxin system ParD family antitoxin [Rhizobium sp. CG5]|uniref:ribbon-helix-helix domain-containing protein n=1 Tax=Rhizobium sp. CG5 TaxID=2726076 RepID=UPI0020341E78|nr:type II toxin-antitoxin system ParD family antitoxin [Rhizobium sp. CG5]MCM2473534.1 type II toxin-antitoxin system ParD family antitoxin [Rhizobium sp. CG5]
MSVKASVSLSPQQEELARKLVEEGHYSSLAAVVQRGLELVREETEMREEDVEALQALIEERRKGKFLTAEESSAQIEAMIARVKASYGL